MKIAVVSETSSADRNADIVAALEGRDHEIINIGMFESGAKPELSYVHTGLIAGLLLNLKCVDFVVGGCGTGQGFLEAAMMYPGVFCGYILSPLDAWLFAQINGGNCISLSLNQGYGWAANINLGFIFDRLFSVERGSGYPPQRKDPQKKFRVLLEDVSGITHRSMDEIIDRLPEEVVRTVLKYPKMMELINIDTIKDPTLKKAIEKRRKAVLH